MEPNADQREERDETDSERWDRNWNELLQEFRVMQTGVQILGGLLLTLPFQPAFDNLDGAQRGLYLILVVLATVSILVMLAPIAVHRRLFQWHRKDRLVRAGHRLARLVIVLIALLVTGIATFIFDVVVGRGAAIAVAGGMLAVSAVALLVVPRAAGGRAPE